MDHVAHRIAGVTLIEALLKITFGTTNQGQRTTLQVGYDPVRNLFVVERQFVFGYPLVGIEDTIGMGQFYPGDAIILARRVVRLRRWLRHFALDLFCRLVFAQALERRMA